MDWLRGQDLHLRLEVMPLVLSYATTAPDISKTQEEMVRVAGVEPAWTCSQGMWVAATLHPDIGGSSRN